MTTTEGPDYTPSPALDLVISVEESLVGELQDADPELVDSCAELQGDEAWVAEWFAERPGRQVVSRWTIEVAAGRLPTKPPRR